MRKLLRFGESCAIEPGAEIDAQRLTIGDHSVIRGNAIIKGRDIRIGHHFYMNHHAEIGGSSCFEKQSKLRIGDNCHLGSYSMINTSREVTIGNNVGIGRLSNIYTHGAYLDVRMGFPEKWGPVKIGDNVWIPNATILPGVTIGDNTVIAACSLVNHDIRGGGLWAGIPAKRVEGVKYPDPWSREKCQSYLKTLKRQGEDPRRHGIRSP